MEGIRGYVQQIIEMFLCFRNLILLEIVQSVLELPVQGAVHAKLCTIVGRNVRDKIGQFIRGCIKFSINQRSIAARKM